MNLKRSTILIQNKNLINLKNKKEYPTIADLMNEQKVTSYEANSVHYRRDLDSLG